MLITSAANPYKTRTGWGNRRPVRDAARCAPRPADNGAFGYKNGLRSRQRKERVRAKRLLAAWLQHCDGMRRLNGVGESLGRGHGALGEGRRSWEEGSAAEPPCVPVAEVCSQDQWNEVVLLSYSVSTAGFALPCLCAPPRVEGGCLEVAFFLSFFLSHITSLLGKCWVEKLAGNNRSWWFSCIARYWLLSWFLTQDSSVCLFLKWNCSLLI